MKILLIWNSQVIGLCGGMEKVMASFANEMTTRGHQVTLVYCTEKKEELCFALNPSITLLNIVDFIPGKAWESARPLFFIIKREFLRIFNKLKMKKLCIDYEIAHSSDAVGKIIKTAAPDIIISLESRTTLLVESALGKNIPLVTMSHFNAEFILQNATAEEKDALRKSSIVQVLMPHDAEVFKKAIPGIRTVRIPDIVPQYDIDDTERKPVIVNVARLDGRQKRQHLLIEAFAKIADRFPKWTLEFWGEEQSKTRYTKRLKAMIQKYHLEGRVFLKGNTSDVETIYRRGSIFAFPSAYEGFGLAMTEAMSAGIPAVAYRSCPAVNEIIRDGETGILCKDGRDPLADALAHLMENETLRHRLGAAAKEDMKQYAAQTVWDQWENLMTNIVSETK